MSWYDIYIHTFGAFGKRAKKARFTVMGNGMLQSMRTRARFLNSAKSVSEVKLIVKVAVGMRRG